MAPWRVRNQSIDHELRAATTRLEALRVRQGVLQKLIDDLTEMQNLAHAQATILEAEIILLKAKKHPINWLPNELLVRIFITFVEDTIHDDADQWCFHYPPVTVSHVCQRWRTVALGCSRLWSRIQRTNCAIKLVSQEVFLRRSNQYPLDIVYVSPPNYASYERPTFERFFNLLRDHSSRWNSFTLLTGSSVYLPKVLELELPSLITFDYSTYDVGNVPGPALVKEPVDGSSQKANMAVPLTSLRLDNVYRNTLPPYLLGNVRFLELASPAHKAPYLILMLALHQALHAMPLLEEIIFSSVTLDFTLEASIELFSIPLHHLKRFEWCYPSSTAIRTLLSFLDAPLLARLEVCFDSVAHIPLASAAQKPIILPLGSSVTFSTLRDLYLQSIDEFTIGTGLRICLFPALEKLTLTNIEHHTQFFRNKGICKLPRLDSIFRDPRLFHLTHLTLSFYVIPEEDGRVMLAYMPALTHLTLEACRGTGSMLNYLAEAIGGFHTANAADTPQRSTQKGIRFCPHLQALCLWECYDVKFESIRAVVCVRNKHINENGSNRENGCDPLHGDGVEEHVRRQLQGITSGSQIDDQQNEDGKEVRKIKPLRRLRRQAQGMYNTSCLSASTSPTTPNSFFMITKPVSITYICIQACSLISQAEAMQLRDQGGVLEVEWSG